MPRADVGGTHVYPATRRPRVEPPAIERFERKVWIVEDGCWLWTGALFKSSGYAMFSPSNSDAVRAHRWSYEHFVGPIPDGLTLDHLCNVPSCVNPRHLEPCTIQENIRRRDERRKQRLQVA